jgi:hypothetical protein
MRASFEAARVGKAISNDLFFGRDFWNYEHMGEFYISRE